MSPTRMNTLCILSQLPQSIAHRLMNQTATRWTEANLVDNIRIVNDCRSAQRCAISPCVPHLAEVAITTSWFSQLYRSSPVSKKQFKRILPSALPGRPVHLPVLVRLDAGIITELVEDILGSFSHSFGLQINGCSIMRSQVVPRVKEGRAVLLHNLPISSARQDFSSKFWSFKQSSLYMSGIPIQKLTEYNIHSIAIRTLADRGE